MRERILRSLEIMAGTFIGGYTLYKLTQPPRPPGGGGVSGSSQPFFSNLYYKLYFMKEY